MRSTSLRINMSLINDTSSFLANLNQSKLIWFLFSCCSFYIKILFSGERGGIGLSDYGLRTKVKEISWSPNSTKRFNASSIFYWHIKWHNIKNNISTKKTPPLFNQELFIDSFSKIPFLFRQKWYFIANYLARMTYFHQVLVVNLQDHYCLDFEPRWKTYIFRTTNYQP